MIRWDVAGPYEVVFTTREGGVSDGPYASLNLGKATRDDPGRVDENRRRVCAAVGADADRLTLNYQHHSATVHRAEAGRKGVKGDGLWTDEPGIPMLKLTADCVPIAIARTGGASGPRPAPRRLARAPGGNRRGRSAPPSAIQATVCYKASWGRRSGRAATR